MHNMTARAAVLASLMLGCSSPTNAEIRIGVILPMSGFWATTALRQQIGFELAAEEINRTAPADKKIIISWKDDEGKPDLARANAVALMERDGIKFIFGAPLSTAAMMVVRETSPRRVLFLSTGSMRNGQGAKIAEQPLWFHIGTDLDKLDELKLRIAKNSSARAATTCGEFTSNEDHFALCTRSAVNNQAWTNFRDSALKKIGNEKRELIDSNAVQAYVALMTFHQAITKSGEREPTPERTAEVLGKEKLQTLFGLRSFDKNKQMLSTAVLVVNPSKKIEPNLLSKINAETKGKCDDCKKGDCPQSMSDALSDDDCCGKSNDCPQGLIISK